MSRWNARADTSSSIILWGGGLAAGMICALWLAQNLYPEQSIVQNIENELSMLRSDVNTACRMDYYWKNYYPKQNEGTLVISGLQICMNSGPCRAVFYENGTEPYFSDGKAVVQDAFPCANPENCSVLYYSSDSSPEFVGGNLEIPDAISCSNKIPAVTRCRVAFCDTKMERYFDLNKITYINLSKRGDTIYAEEH